MFSSVFVVFYMQPLDMGRRLPHVFSKQLWMAAPCQPVYTLETTEPDRALLSEDHTPAWGPHDGWVWRGRPRVQAMVPVSPRGVVLRTWT